MVRYVKLELAELWRDFIFPPGKYRKVIMEQVMFRQGLEK